MFIEKNVVVLTQKFKVAGEGASAKEIKKIDRQNRAIAAGNKLAVDNVKGELGSYFNGDDGQASNSKGEAVRFQFNVSELQVENPMEGNRTMAVENGQDGVMAAIVTQKETNPATTTGNSVITIEPETAGATAHEVGHTLMTGTQRTEESTPGSGGLMTRSGSGVGGSISRREVDKVLKDAVEKKKE